MIRNPVVLCSEKLPFIFLHGTLLSVFMGRRTLAFGSFPPPVGGFWMCSGITTLTLKYSDTGWRRRNTSFCIFELQSQDNKKAGRRSLTHIWQMFCRRHALHFCARRFGGVSLRWRSAHPVARCHNSLCSFYGVIITNLCSLVNRKFSLSMA